MTRNFFRRYRMTRQCVMDVIDIVRNDIANETNRSHALSVEQQTFAALRYYASGSFQQVTGDTLGISQSSVSRSIQKVSTALSNRGGQFIRFPTDGRHLQQVKEGFMDTPGFPNVIGCVDGSLIPIKAPSTREDIYVCRKGFHALNVQGICDSQKKFLNLFVKFPGSAHDAFVWSQCGIHDFLSENRQSGYLLGDQAYPLKPFLLTPVRNPTTAAEEAYNRLHQRTRRLVEDTFGRWKCRWLMLHKFGGAMTIELKTAIKAIIATGVLHNICEDRGIPVPEEDLEQDDDHDDEIEANQNNNAEEGVNYRARLIRERFK